MEARNIMDLIPPPEMKPKMQAKIIDLQKNDRFQGTTERVFISELKEKLHEKDPSAAKDLSGIKRNDAVRPVKNNGNDAQEDQNTASVNEMTESNQAAATDGDVSLTNEKLDKIDKAIKAKVQKIQEILAGLGIDVTPEQIMAPDFLKKVGEILTAFLVASGEEGVAVAVSMPEIEQALSVKISVKPEEVTGMLKTLKDAIDELNMLLDFKDFMVKSADAAQNGDVLIAEKPATGNPAGADVKDDATKTKDVKPSVTLVVEDGKTPLAEENAQKTPVTLESIVATENGEDAEQAVSAIPEDEATAVPQTEKPVPKKEIKPEAGQNNQTPMMSDALKPDIKDVVVEVAAVPVEPAKNKKPQEVIVEIPAAVALAVAEAKKKAGVEAAATGIDAAAQTGAQQAEGENKIVKGIVESQSKQDGKQELNQNPSQNQAGNESQIKPDAADKNPLIKTLSDLKEAILHTMAQPRGETAQGASEITGSRAPAPHLANDKAVPEKAVLHQIVTKFQLLSGQHGSEIRVQLKPDQLGSIKISIEVNQDTVTARMQVENQKVKEIVEGNMQTLKNALEESGIKVEKFEVTVDQGREEFFGRELSEQGRRARGLLRSNVTEDGGDAEMETGDAALETGRRYGYNTVEFVG